MDQYHPVGSGDISTKPNSALDIAIQLTESGSLVVVHNVVCIIIGQTLLTVHDILYTATDLDNST